VKRDGEAFVLLVKHVLLDLDVLLALFLEDVFVLFDHFAIGVDGNSSLGQQLLRDSVQHFDVGFGIL
jgi:hypothetical protein